MHKTGHMSYPDWALLFVLFKAFLHSFIPKTDSVSKIPSVLLSVFVRGIRLRDLGVKFGVIDNFSCTLFSFKFW